MYDTRAHGESDGEAYVFGYDAIPDVIAALDYLKTRPDVDPECIGVLGLSAGAQISLRAAAETNEISAVIAEGAGYPTFEDWKSTTKPIDIFWWPYMWTIFESTELLSGIHNPIPLRQAVSQIAPTPLLLIAAGYDRLQNQVYFEAAGEPKEYWSRAEPGHINALFAHPEEYIRRVVGFLDRVLLHK
jgi:pimeloyl-ACP methyl ester carboxylesterase